MTWQGRYRWLLPALAVLLVSVVRGLKGFSGISHGLLLGGSPSTGLLFETVGQRRYVVTFPDPDPMARALAIHGCTLSADVND